MDTIFRFKHTNLCLCIDQPTTQVSIALCRMKHNNVVEYLKFFREGDRMYIVMQLIEGASLQDHLNTLIDKGKTMDEPRIWTIFVQLCQALRYIHKVLTGP